MSKLRKLSRKLKLNYVSSAIQVHDKRRELAFDMIRERVSTDKEFAADVLHAAGDTIPKDIREIAEKTISAIRTVSLTSEEELKCNDDLEKAMLLYTKSGLASTIIDDGELDGHGYTINHTDKLKSTGCSDEGCICVDVPKEELLKTLEASSAHQTEMLKASGLL